MASAGSLVHFLLALVLIWSVFTFFGARLAAPTVSSLFELDNHARPGNGGRHRAG